MAGTFGAGTPFIQSTPSSPWGLSPYGPQGVSINPFALHQFQSQPFGPYPWTQASAGPYGAQPLQQVAQLLQLLPQQLQQIEHLQLHQLQQLQHVQQLVQVVPAQLAQLQQLIQFGSRQLQPSTPFQQPFSQIPGLSSSMT